MIINCNSSSCIFEIIESISVVISDLDGVVMAPDEYGVGPLGFHQYRLENLHRLSIDTIMEWAYILNNNTNYSPVSKSLNDYLSNHQNKIIIGMTARTSWFAGETIAQLKSVGMQFPTSFMCTCIPEILIQHGVIFVGHSKATGLSNDKGKVIHDMFLSSCFEGATSMVLIDDSKENLLQMERSLADSSLTFIGIHYTEKHDSFHKQYSQTILEKIAQCQWKTFTTCGYFPSNQECIELSGACQPKCPVPLKWL